MERHRWQRFQALVRDFEIRPILAVIPDNHDAQMKLSPSDPGFWAQMREMEAAGAAIAAHGFQHICANGGQSLIGLHTKTEFAGLPMEIQQKRVGAGLQILRDHGLHPRLWVAPRHTFDMNTLRAVREEGLKYISDGLARMPFTRGGIAWIPQQLWSPVYKAKGLWTICIHSNTAPDSQVEKLRSFLKRHSAQFTSFDRVAAEFSASELGFTERLYEEYAIWRLKMHRLRMRHRHKRKD